jgi:hypothetical protein
MEGGIESEPFNPEEAITAAEERFLRMMQTTEEDWKKMNVPRSRMENNILELIATIKEHGVHRETLDAIEAKIKKDQRERSQKRTQKEAEAEDDERQERLKELRKYLPGL